MGELQHVRIYMLFGNNNKFARTDIFKMKPKKFTQNTLYPIPLNRISAFFAYSQPNTDMRRFFYKNNEKLCKMLFTLLITSLKFRSFQ